MLPPVLHRPCRFFVAKSGANVVENRRSNPRTGTPQGHLQCRKDLGVTLHDRGFLNRFRNRKKQMSMAMRLSGLFVSWVVFKLVPTRPCELTSHSSTPATQKENESSVMLPQTQFAGTLQFFVEHRVLVSFLDKFSPAFRPLLLVPLLGSSRVPHQRRRPSRPTRHHQFPGSATVHGTWSLSRLTV